MRSKRTIATDINNDVRKKVLERDMNRCIFCHSQHSLTLAHIVPRSYGGLGVEKNLVVACSECHYYLDHTSHHSNMMHYAKEHIRRIYGEFNEKELIYRK